MNYKNVILIALALCLCFVLPVAAAGMWNGNNWVDSTHNDQCTAVVFNPQSGNTNCYNSNIGSVADIKADPNTYSGWAEVRIRSHSNELNPVMYLANAITPNITMEIAVNHDGLNTIKDLAPGEYILTLDNFNLPDETEKFPIRASQMGPTYVTFIGQAAGGVPERIDVSPEPQEEYKICKALYYPDLSKKPIEGHVKLTWRNNFGIANVRAAVQSLVDGGQTSFVVSNDNLNGDPAYGWYKRLSVWYVTGDDSCKNICKWKHVSANEYSTITLNPTN